MHLLLFYQELLVIQTHVIKMAVKGLQKNAGLNEELYVSLARL